MSTFNAAESAAATRLIDLALAEDVANLGDRTSDAIIPANGQGQATFIARKPGVLAGMPVVRILLEKLQPRVQLVEHRHDGDALEPKTKIATMIGSMRTILLAERTALNFIQRLCGIASLTRRYVEAIEGLPCVLLDTRKTTPGWRMLEKYAVRMGGGTNHRMGLYDGILIKDNHLSGVGNVEYPITDAIRQTRAAYGDSLPIEIEVDTLIQLEEALSSKPDIVLLDNMTPEQLRLAIKRRDAVSPKTLLEASGGVTLETVRSIVESGVDRVSVGALTHSATALDIGLDYGS